MSRQWINVLCVSVWGVIALWITFSFMVAVSSGLYHGPFKDMWWMMPLVEDVYSGHARFQDFMAVHGGAHRLAIPRILYLLDFIFFSGSNRFLVVVSLLAQCVAFVVWFLQIRALKLARIRKLFLWGLVLLVCFSGIQIENVLYTFDCQWFLANTFSLLALVYLVKDLTLPSVVHNRLLVFFFGICASFCSFLGVCVLVLAAVISLYARRQDGHVWLQTCFILVFVIWYVSGFESNAFAVFDGMPVSTPFVAAGVFTLRLLQWTLIYIGSPLTRDVQWLGMLMAACAIAYVLVQCVRFLRNPRDAFTAPELFFLFVALFALAVVVATGLGRMYFIHTADEDRYQTINMTFWLGTWLLLLTPLCHQPWYKQRLVGVLVVLWAGYVGLYWHSRDILARLREFELVRASVVAQAVGVTDYLAIRDTLILGDKARQINRGMMHRHFLQERALGAYATDVAQHYGQAIMPALKSGSCQIIPSEMQMLSSGHWRFRIKLDGVVADRVWVVDPENIIRGSMVPVQWEYANAMHVFTLAPPIVEWLGYANLETLEIGSVKVLVFRDGQLQCEAEISLNQRAVLM